MQECARAVLLTPAGEILLMKIRGWERELWTTPGGRIRTGEDPIAALRRELLEETGREEFAIEGPIWVRQGSFVTKERRVEERETFYLVRTERFEPSTDGFEPEEASIHLGFRWWTLEELEASTDFMVPARLPFHLRGLFHSGLPAAPIDVSG